MGDETIQFASRFASAVSRLAELAGGGADRKPLERQGRDLAPIVRDALDAVEAVYGTGTQAVRNWPEQRRRVLAQVASMREALDGAGVDARIRRMAGALVELIEPSSGRG